MPLLTLIILAQFNPMPAQMAFTTRTALSLVQDKYVTQWFNFQCADAETKLETLGIKPELNSDFCTKWRLASAWGLQITKLACLKEYITEQHTVFKILEILKVV